MIRCLITDGSASVDLDTWLARISAAVEAGANMIQVRERDLSAHDLAAVVQCALTVVPESVEVLVNDRTDVALAAGAHGVHLRSNSIAPRDLRPILPEGFRISVSCHSFDDVVRAAGEGADYAVLAPVFKPLSKEDDRTPLGLEELARAARAVPIGVIALGGITEARAMQCGAAGAAGVAGISLFRRRSTPEHVM